jgi:hypothetical protein
MGNDTPEETKILLPQESAVALSHWGTTASIEATQTEVANPTPQPSTPPADAVGLSLLLSSVMITIPCVFIVAEIWSTWQRWRLNRPSESPIPCKTCHFFSKNLELACAVHPCTALTEAAINCSDYRPKKPQISFKKISVK